MNDEMSDIDKANVRSDLYMKFCGQIRANPNGALAVLIGRFNKSQRPLKTAKRRLDKALNEIRMKPLYPDGFFTDHDSRVKDEESLLIKLFNKSWKKNGFNQNWPRQSHRSFLKELVDDEVLSKAYDEIKDLIGGRMVVSCKADIQEAVEDVRRELRDRGFEESLKPEEKDKDYTSSPRDGFYGYFIHMRVPIRKATAKRRGSFHLAEIQIVSLLGSAWAKFGHDTFYKVANRPCMQILPSAIGDDWELISGSLQVTDGLFGSLRKRSKGNGRGF